MAFQNVFAVLAFCVFSKSSALLFHGDGVPGQTTTLGPLGKDATLSLLVKNVLDLETRLALQEKEIQTLKNQKSVEENVTSITVNKLMSEYADIKIDFGIIKREFEQNNNQTGLLALKTRQDNMAQSIRYLTLSLQSHEIQDEAMNMSIHQELGQLSLQITELGRTTNNTLTDIVRTLQSDIKNLTASESADIHRLGNQLSTMQIALRSDLGRIETKLNLVNRTFLNFIKPNAIRLEGGNSNSGRVEVRFLGSWGTVCDDGFGVNDAKVVCRMLGHSTSNAQAFGFAHFGQGTGPIVYDDLGCTGSESNLFDCPHVVLGHHDCKHTEDAGVSCG